MIQAMGVFRAAVFVGAVLSGVAGANAATPPPSHAPARPAAQTHNAVVQKPTPAATTKATTAPAHASAPVSTVPFPDWLVALLVCLGIALILSLGAFALRFFLDQDNERGAGSLILLTLPVLAALGLVLIPFAPGLDTGRWIPVDVLAIAVFVGGAFLGFLYGLPVVDADALKTAGTSAGTFIRPRDSLI